MNLTSSKNWKTVKLGEIAHINMGQSPTSDTYNQDGEGLPFYQGVTEFGDKYLSIKTYTTNPIKIAEEEDIIFSVRAPVGRINITKNRCCIGRGNASFRTKEGDQNFLYFLLKSLDKKIQSQSSGTVFDSINKDQLNNLEIFYPESVTEQKEIADMLGVLDDKIDLFRAQNKTLESIAQALFKEWFVDFKFPDATGKMIDSELGQIPEGWNLGTVMSVIDRLSISYKSDKDDLDPQGKTPIIDQGVTGLYGYTKRDPDMQASTENPVIVFTNHTCNLWFINYPFCAIQNVIPFRGKEGYDEYFIYFMTKGQVSFIEYKGHWPDFEIKEYIIPPVEIAKQFSVTVKPMVHRIWGNNTEIKTLSKLRDDLLNKIFQINL